LSTKRVLGAVLATWLIVAAAFAGNASAGHNAGGDRELEAILNGFAEVSPATGEFGAGDLNGDGTAEISLASDHRVCFELHWSDIGRPAAAHIHLGRVGENGDIVVDLLSSARDFEHDHGEGEAEGCVRHVPRQLIHALLRNPRDYYVNVHNAVFPGGAVRGNLERDEDF
jgi:hypothetical protein